MKIDVVVELDYSLVQCYLVHSYSAVRLVVVAIVVGCAIAAIGAVSAPTLVVVATTISVVVMAQGGNSGSRRCRS